MYRWVLSRVMIAVHSPILGRSTAVPMWTTRNDHWTNHNALAVFTNHVTDMLSCETVSTLYITILHSQHPFIAIVVSVTSITCKQY